MPLQIGSFAWLWFGTAREVNKGVRSAEAQLQPLQERIRAASSSADLWAALASSGQVQPPAPPQMPPLPQQKQELLTAIDRRLSQQRTTLSQQRIQLLTSQLLACLRGVVAAASVAAGLHLIRRKV